MAWTARVPRALSRVFLAAAFLAATAGAAHAQGRGGQPPEWEQRGVPNGVLWSSSRAARENCENPFDCANDRFPMNEADSLVQTVVAQLDFQSYKDLILGLTQFGDRRQGTERGNQAIDWIEEQLRSWGYETERIHYTYQDEPREQVYATKIGSTTPQEMVILGAHMDGIGDGEGANDNASGTALVMEIARALAPAAVQTDRSIRFALWNNEETGLNGARAYVEQRAPLQGIEEPAGSGTYPEPRWVAMIQHDKVMFDHGLPVQHQQSWAADVDVEFQMVSAMAAESAQLGIAMINANRKFATDYPAALSNSMSNTDSTPFMNLVPSVSVRENRRLYEIGWQGPAGWGARGSDPNWHQPTDLFVTYRDPDFRLGFNAAQTTLGATLELVGLRLQSPLP
jgi:hypothetical protein